MKMKMQPLLTFFFLNFLLQNCDYSINTFVISFPSCYDFFLHYINANEIKIDLAILEMLSLFFCKKKVHTKCALPKVNTN